ncbi:tRNA-guanine(15) transglycosylase-like protein [Absidia repens]|uniref:tRNA-guanine(15) transglycosylase-like protein n=1 Tax=Absidia repens TaxID=90262 RepID=A0A1X2IEB9_9FUNG|nr:tRNA-guanine(15) transglycosylase-like protein [Absidia repens]
MTLELWKKLLESYQPDLVAAMADIVCDKDAKTRRIARSVDRSLRWLDECLPKAKETNTPIFAPVMGHTSIEERKRSAVETMEREGVDGYIVSVLGLKQEEDLASLLQASLEPLPSDKPKLAYGMDSPEHILLGVANGVDLFDGSYAYKMTEHGRAITFKFGSKKLVDGKIDKVIDLWNTNIAQTFDPLDVSCGCYTCTTPHTKAYIHHLLKAHEMLGSILLMRHNIYQLGQFMADIRQSIEKDTFKQDMNIFMQQYNHGNELENSKEDARETVDSLGVASKKKWTLEL